MGFLGSDGDAAEEEEEAAMAVVVVRKDSVVVVMGRRKARGGVGAWSIWNERSRAVLYGAGIGPCSGLPACACACACVRGVVVACGV